MIETWRWFGSKDKVTLNEEYKSINASVREKFEGNNHAQVFLHYNIKNDKGNSNLYDQRLHLGLPSGFKKDLRKTHRIGGACI